LDEITSAQSFMEPSIKILLNSSWESPSALSCERNGLSELIVGNTASIARLIHHTPLSFSCLVIPL